MNIISILGIIGLIGLGIGLWAHIYLRRFKRPLVATDRWNQSRITVVIIGLVIGVLTVPGTVLLGYPLTHNGETHRILGIPFMAAMFDRKGRDYVGFISLLSVIGNSIFWYSVPQIIFVLYTKIYEARFKNDLA